ncbi:hypothetical protein E8E13_002395 [Curvularia kusanoi]|uniref:Ubiquitin-protein ligase E3A N-terminal zinc-binding domain-containing protein n=1 Tax=Curvularia kusanoi TaxID=90978 RepID=A0A9P4WD87_CURKU|nr:hypothetical protein E8E13_002395 [Curvularia kusanoi]
MATDAEPAELSWSAQFTLAHHIRSTQLPGDKILLPPSALEQLLAAAPVVTLDSNRPHITSFDPFNPYTHAAERQARAQFQDRHQQLPHPLTFRLVNPDNGRAVYAGIREFSAEEGQVVLSSFLRDALGIESGSVESSKGTSPNAGSDGDVAIGDGEAANGATLTRITVHAKQLPKGTFVKLRPLEAGYDPEDWKSLLEEHMRSNFTTLTNGEVLVVYGGRGPGGKREEFRFLVDGFKPDGEGICVVDTDLEVDIEALNEEQARETLKSIVAKRQKAPGTTEGSSVGGVIDIFRGKDGQVLEGEYVDFDLQSWDRSQGLEITLSGVDDEEEIDLYVSPYSAQQRVRPRDDEHVFADTSSHYPKCIRIPPTNAELDEAEAVWISIHAFPSKSPSDTPKSFHLGVSLFDPGSKSTNNKEAEVTSHGADEVQCKNCTQWVPKSSLFLHENFCLRNNILCPQGCGQVFQKRSPEFQNHWHCPHDTFTGNTPLSLDKHNTVYHTPRTCNSCSLEFPSLPTLAHHKTTTCPGKLILCRFCHLQVPQEGDPTEPPNPELLLSGLTPHELADGGRTTECHLCGKIVRFRDMETHLRHHDLERLSRPAPRVCRNVNCGRTQDGANKMGDTRAGTRKGQGPGNEIGLCSVCFGPLYVSMHDPEGKALRRRIERRYLSQLLTGCGRPWCRNDYCRAGKKNQGQEDQSVPTREAIPMVKPFLEGMDGKGYSTPLHFCVDEASQNRRVLAEMLTAEKGIEGKGGYSLEWCVAALEAENGDLDRARSWLKGWAPQRTEAS